jgi:hypothetical protein
MSDKHRPTDAEFEAWLRGAEHKPNEPLKVWAHPEANQPSHWRKRAEEVRRLMIGEPPENQTKLQLIVDAYEDLAKRAEERLRAPDSQ